MIAENLDVPVNSIYNFDITAEEDSTTRRTLLSYTLSVSFDVQVSLSDMGTDSSEEISEIFESALAANSTFETAITTTVSIISEIDTVVAVVFIRPTSQPTSLPTSSPERKNDGEDINYGSASMLGIIIPVCVVLLCVFPATMFLRSWDKRRKLNRQAIDEQAKVTLVFGGSDMDDPATSDPFSSPPENHPIPPPKLVTEQPPSSSLLFKSAPKFWLCY